MKEMLKNKAIYLIEKIHLKIFGHPMSPEMKKFIGNLSWSFAIGIFAMPVLMLIATLVGRFIGPVEYGKYSLLLVINQFLVVFIFYGLDTTTIKYIAKAKSFNDKQKVISASSTFILFTLTLMIVLAIIAFPFLLRFFRSYLLFTVLLLIYTLLVCFKVMLDLFIRGLEKFKMQAQAKALEIGVIALFFIFLFLILKRNNYTSFLFILNAGAIAIAIYYFVNLKKYFVKYDKNFLLEQLSESKWFFISALLGTLYLSTDRLVVSKYLGIETLGIYSAYYMASFGVIAQIAQLFTNVFFSVTSRLKDKSFANKIDRLFVVGLIPLILIIVLIMLVILLIFGKEYPINIFYMFGFSLLASLYFFQALYNTVIADVSKDEYRKYLIVRNIASASAFVLYGAIIYFHVVSIAFILSILIINMIVAIFIQRLYIKGMQQRSLL